MADSFEEDFRNAVIGFPSIAALIGDRFFWSDIPQGAERPFISCWNVTFGQGYTMAGPDGLIDVMLQLDVWGMSHGDAVDVARVVMDRFDGLQGTIGATDIRGVFFRGRRDSKEPMAGETAQPYYRRSIDVEVWFRTIEAEPPEGFFVLGDPARGFMIGQPNSGPGLPSQGDAYLLGVEAQGS